jgi:hypothetical protein
LTSARTDLVTAEALSATNRQPNQRFNKINIKERFADFMAPQRYGYFMSIYYFTKCCFNRGIFFYSTHALHFLHSMEVHSSLPKKQNLAKSQLLVTFYPFQYRYICPVFLVLIYEGHNSSEPFFGVVFSRVKKLKESDANKTENTVGIIA